MDPSPRFALIISDIAGCLGPESAAPMHAAALAEIAAHNELARARRDRPVLTVCSGRPQPYAEAMCRFLANDMAPCICENGVWIYEPRGNLYLRDPAIAAEHLAAVHEATLWLEAELIPKGIVIQPGKTASISLWHPDTDLLMGQMPRLTDEFAKRAWPFRVSRTVAWINLDLEHVSKGSGIRRLKERTGLDTPRLAGIGDMPGDLAIREHVAWFACPSNADPAIKAASDYISPLPEVEGVRDILRVIDGMR